MEIQVLVRRIKNIEGEWKAEREWREGGDTEKYVSSPLCFGEGGRGTMKVNNLCITRLQRQRLE